MVITSDSKVHEANMGPIRVWQDPSGSHVGPMNFAIWDFAPGCCCNQATTRCLLSTRQAPSLWMLEISDNDKSVTSVVAVVIS